MKLVIVFPIKNIRKLGSTAILLSLGVRKCKKLILEEEIMENHI